MSGDFNKRLQRLRTDVEMHARSSKWLCQQIDDIIMEYQSLSDPTNHQLEELDERMESLYQRALWEDKEKIRIEDEYQDII